MKEFYIADDGIQLHAKLDVPEEKEKCPLVIVFHGLTGNMEERHITAVSSAMNEIGFATLRVELYGHGKSGGAFEQHNLMKWINNAMTVTDYAKTLDFVTDLYICGHSRADCSPCWQQECGRMILRRRFRCLLQLSLIHI